MARIRTIKPEFWLNEELANVSEPARLVAIGLLNLSDDEGWFKAHARLVESALFPFSEPSVSIQQCLSDLSQIGYIRIYEGSDGKQYGTVVKFSEHQRVNRPSPSKIGPLIEFTEDSLITHEQLTVGKERKGREGNRERKGKESIPDSIKTSFDDIIDNIIDLYHHQLPNLSVIKVRTGVIKKQLTARLQDKDRQDGDWWREYFGQVASSDWLMGRSGNFKCTLQWLTLPTNMDKVLNGQYDSHQATGITTAPQQFSKVTQQNISTAQAWANGD